MYYLHETSYLCYNNIIIHYKYTCYKYMLQQVIWKMSSLDKFYHLSEMKYLVTVAEQLGAGSDLNLLNPHFATTKNEAKEFITDLIQQKINMILPVQWWSGKTIGNYVTSSNGNKYQVESPLHKIVAQISDERGFVYVLPDNAAKLWNYSNNKYVQDSISMLLVSAQASGEYIRDLKPSRLNTYQKLLAYTPDEDFISMMIVLYAMQRSMDIDATFLYDTMYWENQPALILQTPTEDVIVALNMDFEYDVQDTREICDPVSLYELSPMYRGIPHTMDGLKIMYQNRVSDWQQFSLLMELAMKEMYNTEIVQQASSLVRGKDRDSIFYMLSRIASKAKIVDHVQQLFNIFPCSLDICRIE